MAGQGTHDRRTGLQPLAGAARRARHSPVHRHGVRLLGVLAAAVEGARHHAERRLSRRRGILRPSCSPPPATGRSRTLGWMYTLFFVFLGCSAAIWGGWLERAGPRKAGVVSAVCWCGGMLISALGIYLHQIWMMLLGSGRHRRHRPRARLHLAGVDADQVVPRSPRHGDRHGDHGLRRRRHDRLAAGGPC